jgi:thiosulfate/3-mercaptopyruvate sulfurtransferase
MAFGEDGIQPAFPAAWPNSQFIVETDWLEKNLQNPNLALIHISPANDLYARGHIPGSVFIPYKSILNPAGQPQFRGPSPEGMTDLLQSAGINRVSRVLIIYESTPWIRTLADATRLFWTLEYLGHDQVAVLNGGLEKWLQEKRPTTTDRSFPRKGDFTPRKVNPSNFLDMAAMKERTGRKDGMILDTRNDLEYFGITLRKPDLPRSGHIPGAKLFPWLYYFQENPRGVWAVRPAEEIEAMHKGMGVENGLEIALYCNSGHLCTANYWILRLMGFSRVRVYIGSMAEWSRYPAKEAPLTRYRFE